LSTKINTVQEKKKENHIYKSTFHIQNSGVINTNKTGDDGSSAKLKIPKTFLSASEIDVKLVRC